MPTKKLTRRDLAEAAETYKNWGKWGSNDEIGTLNYTSPEDIIAAMKEIIGAMYQCECDGGDAEALDLPPAARSLLFPYRILRS